MSVFISSLSFLQVSSTLQNLAHPLSEGEGIDIRVAGEEDKPTIMMLMKNLVPVRDTCTYHSLAIKTEHENTCDVHILVLYAATLANVVIKMYMIFFLSTLFFSYSSLHLKVQEKPTIMTLIRCALIGECKVPVITCSKCFCTSNCFQIMTFIHTISYMLPSYILLLL